MPGPQNALEFKPFPVVSTSSVPDRCIGPIVRCNSILYVWDNDSSSYFAATTRVVASLPADPDPNATYQLSQYPGSSLQWDAGQSKYVGTLGSVASLAAIQAVPAGIQSLLALGVTAGDASGVMYFLSSNGWDVLNIAVQNQLALLPFWAALANRDSAPVKILNLGDSVSTGARCGSWPAHYGKRLADNLMNRFPCIGGNPAGGYYIPVIQTSPNGPAIPVVVSGPSLAVGAYYGPGFNSGRLEIGSTLTLTVVGTSMKIWTIRRSGTTQSLSITVDGGSTDTVTIPASGTGSSIDGYLVNVPLGASGSHTVVITSSTSAHIAGFDIYNGDETKGVHPVFGGHSGYSAADYIATEDGNNSYSLGVVASTVAPSLITIFLGLNDWGKGIESASQYASNLEKMVLRLKSGAPDSAILLVFPFVSQQQAEPLESFSAYRNAMASAAAKNNCAFVDLSSVMPAATGAKPYGLYYTDKLHPYANGHTMIADIISAAITTPNHTPYHIA